MRAQHVYIFLERIKQDVFVSLPPIISHCCLCVCIILYLCRDEDYRSEADVSNGTFIGYKPHIEELEMLLEAYFVQIDGTLNKLSHVMTLPFPVPCIAPKCSYNLLFVVSMYITNESTIL